MGTNKLNLVTALLQACLILDRMSFAQRDLRDGTQAIECLPTPFSNEISERISNLVSELNVAIRSILDKERIEMQEEASKLLEEK